MTPPFADNGSQSEHTVLPFWDRKLLYVSSEASAGGCDTEPLNYAGFVDNSNPAKPRLISIFPPPRPPAGKPYKDFCDKGGRFGPHNVNQEIHNPDVMPNGNTLYIAYFNAGLQNVRHQRRAFADQHRLLHPARTAGSAQASDRRTARIADQLDAKTSSSTPAATSTPTTTSGASGSCATPTTPASPERTLDRSRRRGAPMRILIVEDDPRLFGPMADDLRRQRHTVDVATDGKTGFEYAASGLHDVILLDVMLPGGNGLGICRQLREAGNQSMILMITALDAIEDKVAALDAGADDYIVKPMDFVELAARIRAVTRRAREIQPPVLAHNGLVLDPRAASVTVRDRPLELTRSEYIILETLMRHRRQLFTRQMLHDKLASIDSDTAPESIRTHVGNLRRKLCSAGCDNLVETVYGSGYRFSGK